MKMKCPPHMTSISFDGEEFVPDADGVVDVPKGAVAQLETHGLTVHQPGPEPATPKSAAQAEAEAQAAEEAARKQAEEAARKQAEEAAAARAKAEEQASKLAAKKG